MAPKPHRLIQLYWLQRNNPFMPRSEIAEKLGVSRNYLRVLLHRLKRNGGVSHHCPECYAPSLEFKDGELTCTACGLVLAEELQGPEVAAEEEKLYRQPENPLMFHRGLGTYDESRFLSELRKRGIIKRLNTSHLRVDDETTQHALTILARRCQTKTLDWSVTSVLARRLRKRLKNLVSSEQLEALVDEVWNDYFRKNEHQG